MEIQEIHGDNSHLPNADEIARRLNRNGIVNRNSAPANGSAAFRVYALWGYKRRWPVHSFFVFDTLKPRSRLSSPMSATFAIPQPALRPPPPLERYCAPGSQNYDSIGYRVCRNRTDPVEYIALMDRPRHKRPRLTPPAEPTPAEILSTVSTRTYQQPSYEATKEIPHRFRPAFLQRLKQVPQAVLKAAFIDTYVHQSASAPAGQVDSRLGPLGLPFPRKHWSDPDVTSTREAESFWTDTVLQPAGNTLGTHNTLRAILRASF